MKNRKEPNKIQKFEALFEQYHRTMMSTALRILNNERDAEDAVSAAGEALYKNIGKIKTVESPEACSYVVLTVESKALDILRKRKTRNEVSLEDVQYGIEFSLPDTSLLEGAIIKLPARYRQAILLRFGMGYSTKEVAKLMNITPANAQRLLWRAKEQLKNILDEKEEQNYEKQL